MSQFPIHAPEQTSRFNTYVSNFLMGAVLILSAVLFYGQFAA